MNGSRFEVQYSALKVDREAFHDLRQLQWLQGSHQPLQSTSDDLPFFIFVDPEENSLICCVEVVRKIIECLSDLYGGYALLEGGKLTLYPSKPKGR